MRREALPSGLGPGSTVQAWRSQCGGQSAGVQEGGVRVCY